MVWPARLARAAELGIVLADHLVGPLEQQLPVVIGHAEDPGDHRDRERRGDALDEVELVGRRRSAAASSRISTAMRSISSWRDRIARGVKRGIATRRNGPWRGGSSVTTISVGCAGAPIGPEDEPVRVREDHRLRRHVGDVGVLGDRPERLVARRLEVRHRRLGPQLRPHRVAGSRGAANRTGSTRSRGSMRRRAMRATGRRFRRRRLQVGRDLEQRVGDRAGLRDHEVVTGVDLPEAPCRRVPVSMSSGSRVASVEVQTMWYCGIAHKASSFGQPQRLLEALPRVAGQAVRHPRHVVGIGHAVEQTRLGRRAAAPAPPRRRPRPGAGSPR